MAHGMRMARQEPETDMGGVRRTPETTLHSVFRRFLEEP
jgi:hypothetical protein